MSTSNSSLRPAWYRGNQGGGRGFQPPPQVGSERNRSQSVGTTTPATATEDNKRESSSNFNKFAALNDEDDAVVAAASSGESLGGSNSGQVNNNNVHSNSISSPVNGSQGNNSNNSRSEALRSSGGLNRNSSTGSRPAGRKLAEYAATVPSTSTVDRERSSGRFNSLRNNSIGSEREASGSNSNTVTSGSLTSTSTPGSSNAATPSAVDTVKVVRFTRERLLSMRPKPLDKATELLAEQLEGTSILSDEPQDPVCWDTFDAEEIWSTAPRRSSKTLGTAAPSTSSGVIVPSTSTGVPSEDASGLRRSGSTGVARIRELGSTNAAPGRWQRGVALPPADQAAGKRGKDRDADDPSDLWDDPGSSEGITLDFSAFGSIPADDVASNIDAVFDFEKMAEATQKFEEELHGNSRSRASSNAESDKELDANDDDTGCHNVIKVDPKRPLATDGTTIRSGSGDNVNVFEDFDDPASSEGEESNNAPASTIKAADEDPDASSRLMALIGVKKEEEPVPVSDHIITPIIAPPTPVESKLSAWGMPDPILAPKPVNDGIVLGLSLNPWGDSVLSIPNNDHHRMQGLDIQARLREAELEQKAREDELRRRQEQEEAQRRALAQQQAEQERVRQATIQQQQQQQAGVQSQVENVLMERISTILENSWGRSDLVSILSTLHTEDSRVIPLLNNVDALRALLLRNPQRVALRQDPTLRAEMAALLMTNAQWQQQQQAAQQAAQHAQRLRAQQEEMQRREQQRRIEEQQQHQAAVAAAAARAQQQIQQSVTIIPDAPWYYSDPQKNIQGPFRGEEMRQWFEAGYFKGDLPISQQPIGPFRQLSGIFPDLTVAFMTPRNAAVEEAAARAEERARMEAERMAQAEAMAERERLENERRAKELANERERRAREAAAERQRLVREMAERERLANEATESENRNNMDTDDSNNGGNESSAQLKLLLGLNSNFSETKEVLMASGSDPQSKTQQNAKHTEKKTPKSSNRNNQLQPLVETLAPNSTAAPLPVVVSTAPAWGGAAVVKPAAKKSMSEIQKEEERAAAVAATKQDGGRSSSSGWANVAASRGGSNAWAGGTAQQKPVVVLSKVAAPVPVPAKAPVQQSRSTSVQSPAVPTQQLQRAASGPSESSIVAASSDAFGAKMSPQLEKWCKDQMQKLNGTDDLTLVSFCMTLNDSAEIRQYLTTYLGTTPAVNNFATEFINRAKGVSKEKTEEWESTVTVKKARKKKTTGGAGGSNR